MAWTSTGTAMTHPIYDALAALHEESRRRCGMFWLIGTLINGEWRPRVDFPLCEREDVAKAVADEQTVRTKVKHEARRFDVAEGRV